MKKEIINNKQSRKNRILAVDDQPNNLKLISSLLKQHYEVFLAMDGNTALQIAHEKKPELILLDIMMPGLNGFQVCEKLKEDVATQEIPVVFLTAKNADEDLEKAFEVGGVDFILKPIRSVELLARINTHITISLQKKNLKELNVKVSDLNRNLEEKVDSRTKDLYRAMADLKKRNIALHQFSSIISHNLRGPVATVLGLAQVLKLTGGSITDKEKIFSEITNTITNLDEIVRDLTKIMEIKDVAHLKNETLKIKEIIADINSSFEELVNENNYELVYDIQEGLLTFITNRGYLIEVLNAVIENSIEHNNDKGKLTVSVSFKRIKSVVHIVVRDNGPGIDAKNLRLVFEPYKKFNSRSNGRGLGLYIAKVKIEALGGKIAIDSDAGEGTTVMIVLPQDLTS